MRLAGGSLMAIDDLPVSGGDQLGLARGQPVGQLVGIVFREIRQSAFSARARSEIRVSTVSWESFLLVPITPVGPRLIQPTTYSLRLPSTRPSVFGIVAAFVVERQPRGGHTAVADRPHYQLNW